MTEEKRRGGRPATGKRGTFTFRVTDTLRAKLEADAALQRRPISEVIEDRLVQSYDRQALLADVRAAIANGERDRQLIGEYGPHGLPYGGVRPQ